MLSSPVLKLATTIGMILPYLSTLLSPFPLSHLPLPGWSKLCFPALKTTVE